jgi:hypothetical protein
VYRLKLGLATHAALGSWCIDKVAISSNCEHTALLLIFGAFKRATAHGLDLKMLQAYNQQTVTARDFAFKLFEGFNQEMAAEPGEHAHVLQTLLMLEGQLQHLPERRLCTPCKRRASKWIRMVKENVWDMLPTVVGL